MLNCLIVTYASMESSLEASYGRALAELGCNLSFYEYGQDTSKPSGLKKIAAKVIKRLGRYFESPSEILKINIHLTKYVLARNISLVVFFTNAPINPSTLVYLRSLGKQVILVYPDAIINMGLRQSSSIALYDAIFSYSELGVAAFRMLGAQNVHWCALAGDSKLHGTKAGSDDSESFDYDISFIGNFRPERERMLEHVINNFPNQRIKIIGDWNGSQSKAVLAKTESRQMYGTAYAQFINRSRLNLNIIDDSNFPAANMRFFEIPTAGGLQISSRCPEMQATFIDGEHLHYYSDADSLTATISHLLDKPEAAQKIRLAGQELVMAKHLYRHRAADILRTLGLGDVAHAK